MQEVQYAVCFHSQFLAYDTLMFLNPPGAVPTGARQDSPHGITFDRFVRCCVSVKSLTDSFMAVDTDRDGWAQISYDQFLSMALSAP